MQTVACIIATCGDWHWNYLARTRAAPSAEKAGPNELIVAHYSNLNVCDARNQASGAARADWLCFLDADDELDPGYFDAMRPYFTEPKLLLAPYVRYVRHERGRKLSTPPHIPNAGRWPEINDTVSGACINTRQYHQMGGWQHDYWPWSDWELWLRAHKHGIRRMHIPAAIYIVHDNPGSENHRVQNPQALHAQVKRLHHEVWEEHNADPAAADPRP